MNRCGDATPPAAHAMKWRAVSEGLRSATRRVNALAGPRDAAFLKQDGARGTAEVRSQTTLVNAPCGERDAARKTICVC